MLKNMCMWKGKTGREREMKITPIAKNFALSSFPPFLCREREREKGDIDRSYRGKFEHCKKASRVKEFIDRSLLQL